MASHRLQRLLGVGMVGLETKEAAETVKWDITGIEYNQNLGIIVSTSDFCDAVPPLVTVSHL